MGSVMVANSIATFDSHDIADYDALFDELFPICRSITGPGFRDSLKIFSRYMAMDTEHIPSGTEVFDWVTPPEWIIRSGSLTGPDGKTVLDFADDNLSIVNYSAPIDQELDLEDLQPHLHSIPDQPALTPYVTSYYQRRWGFCLSHSQRETLEPGRYHARIDSQFTDGEVCWGRAVIPGETKRLVLLSSYLCHPSLANNELSGPLVLLGLYHRIQNWPNRRFSYEFILNPETIGSLCVLHRHHERLSRDLHSGLVLTCLGGPQDSLSVKLSRQGGSRMDRLAKNFSEMSPAAWQVRPFDPTSGSDERQYCSPGFNMPVLQIARTVYGDYPEYHTSGDTKALMGIDRIVDAVDRIERLLKTHEASDPPRNLSPYGEPQLGQRGLYPSVNSPLSWGWSSDDTMDHREVLKHILWVLNLADGTHDLADIAKQVGCSADKLVPVIQRLTEHGLLALDPLDEDV